MKFEHVLQIYWTSGFFIGGRLFFFNQTPKSLIQTTPGLGETFKVRINERFELKYMPKTLTNSLDTYEEVTGRKILLPLNIILSQTHPVNFRLEDLHRLIILRQYLGRTYRGRCHAVGKPVRGQRTWSNAWSSFFHNIFLRKFIGTTVALKNKDKKPIKMNWKMAKKKFKKGRR